LPDFFAQNGDGGPQLVFAARHQAAADCFVHAPRTGRDIEITSMNGTYWKNRYITARRVDRSTRFTR